MAVLLAGAFLLAGAAHAQTPPAAFTIADPAATSSAFNFDSTATHATPPTIVPRLVGPEPPHETLRDRNTGAKIDEFGSAYTYANPLYGTNHPGTDGVGLHDDSGRSATISFVVARFGGPPENCRTSPASIPRRPSRTWP